MILELHGLELFGRHGVDEDERRDGQTFVVDVTLHVDEPNGDRVVTIYSNQTRAAIPAATFEFTPPPGTEVTSPLGR